MAGVSGGSRIISLIPMSLSGMDDGRFFSYDQLQVSAP